MDALRGPRQIFVMQIDQCLVDCYQSGLKRYISSKVRNSADVDDIVQDTFLKFHSRARAHAIAQPAHYLYAIARNLIVDRARSASPLNGAMHIEAVAEGALRIEPAQDHGLRAADLMQAYRAALAELSPRSRQVFRMRRRRGMSTPDVASTLSITPRMVQKHMLAATDHLRIRLQPFAA